MSDFLRINFQDVAKGIAVAVLTAVLDFLYKLIQAKGLNFTGDDWSQLLSVAVLALLGYLAKNFLTDQSGKLFGRIQL